MNKTLIVNRKECEEILTIERTIPVMRTVLESISNKSTTVLQRSMIPHKNGNMLAGMPASLHSENVTGSKVIIFPGPQTAKAGTNQGIIPLFNIETGELKAIIDAELITVVRTGATTAAATDVLANRDAKTVAILGSGKQGRAHAEAMILVRNIEKVYMWDLFMQAAENSCKMMKEKFPEVEFIPCENAEDAVRSADIVCTTTPAKDDVPIIKYEWLKKGAHINAIGACSSRGREIDPETIANAKIFSDWTEACMRDAGDIIIPAQRGEISAIPEMTEIGEVIMGNATGRDNEEQLTMFESVGISVEDIAAADMIYKYAAENNIGVYVEI